MKLSEKIKLLRDRDNITQKELAEKTGINHSALRKYEINVNIPKEKHIVSIANFFQITPSLLKDFDEEQFNVINTGNVYALLITLIKSSFLLYKINEDNATFNLYPNPLLKEVIDSDKIEISFISAETRLPFFKWLVAYNKYLNAKKENNVDIEKIKDEVERIEFALCTMPKEQPNP